MSIVCCELSFSWPDGTVALDGLNAAFGAGRTGLIGVNGSGKSTLLALIAGRLRPGSGSVTVTGDVGYLPQDLTLDTDLPVASLLGIAAVRDAICSIENGDTSEELFAVVGDDWDIEDRARGWLTGVTAPCSRRCCSPSLPRSCCCSTSRPTAWTWRRCGSSHRRFAATGERSSWRATTSRSWRSVGVTRWLRLDRAGRLTSIDPI